MYLKMLLVCCWLFVWSMASAQDKPDATPPWSKPPKLEHRLIDDFEKDSRTNYKIGEKKGLVNWQEGLLTLGDGAVLQRKLNAGSWLEIELELNFPELTEEGEVSELKVWLDLQGATDCFVWFRQKRVGGQTRSAVFLIDTNGEWTQSQPRMSDLGGSSKLKSGLPSGKWKIGYRYGLLQYSSPNNKYLGYGSIENGAAQCQAIIAESKGKNIGLESIEISFADAAADVKDLNGDLEKALDLNDQVFRLWNAGKPQQALPIASKALEIRERLLGRYHADTILSLFNLAAQYQSLRASEKAEPLYLEARDISKTVLGRDHPDYAASLNNIGELYQSKGNYRKAEPLHVEACEIYGKIRGKQHSDYATSSNNLAALYRSMGAYDKAEPLFIEALQIRLKTVGKKHPQYATSLNNLAALYRSMGNDKKAEPLYLEAGEIWRKLLGKNDPRYALVLSNLAGFYQSKRDYEKAQQLSVEARDIRDKILGKQHPDYATSLNQLAGLYQTMGAFDKAEKLYLEARDIDEKALGKKHPKYAADLNSLAQLYQSIGEYEKANPLFVEALKIRERVLGKAHPEYGTSLNNLALFYQSLGAYEKAEPLYLEARDISEKVFGKKHPDYASSLNNLAGLYLAMGSHAKSESLYLEAHKIREETLGRKHPQYAQSLSGLAVLYQSMGAYEQAEPLYLEDQKISEEVLGKEHPDYATCLNNLAGLYFSMGAYAKAEPLIVNALGIRERFLGKEHPDYAQSLNNLATLYRSMGLYEKAEPRLIEARDIKEKLLGKEHPDYAISLVSLAMLYSSKKTYDKAEALLIEARDIQEKLLGKTHPRYSRSLNLLARLYHSMGVHEKAESLFLEARDIEEKVLGKEHPSFATNLSNLGFVYQSMGAPEKAEISFLKALQITRRNFDRYAIIQSEKQRRVFSNSFESRFSAFVCNALRLKNRGNAVWDEAIQWKGISLLRQKRALSFSGHPQIQEAFALLKQIRSQMIVHVQSDPSKKGWQKRMQTLESQEELQEKKLARLIEELDHDLSDNLVKDISLPVNAALVDIRKFTFFVPDSKSPSKFQNKPHYLALIRNSNSDTQMVDLGSATLIDNTITRWRKPIESANKQGRLISPSEQQAMDQAGLELRKLIWQPLARYIQVDQVVIISPDSALGRLPFAALPGDKPESYLIESRKIVSLPVPLLLNDLLSKKPKLLDQKARTLLLGGISYGNAEQSQAVAKKLAFRNGNLLGNMSFTQLENTKTEVTNISNLFPNSNLLTAEAATEKAFVQHAAEHDILHVATHGFFKKPKTIKYHQDLNTQGSQAAFDDQQQVLHENPSLLSGLAFANANNFRNVKFDATDDDGILYSAELAMLPLENVELAVLSACDTGLGMDNARGEGLIGIQRAFQVAGAKTTIASYWKVDDRATQLLMNKFYENLLKFSENATPEKWVNNQTTIRIDALREAQIWMLKNPIVAAQTSRGDPIEVDPKKIRKAEANLSSTDRSKRTHPRFWAAFMLSGDWR